MIWYTYVDHMVLCHCALSCYMQSALKSWSAMRSASGE